MENKININEIFENVKKDISLLSTIDIDELLKAVENEQNDYLENKTLDHLFNENVNSLNKLKISKPKIKEICEKITGYRFVENLSEIHKGKHIRWIKINDIDKKLTNWRKHKISYSSNFKRFKRSDIEFYNKELK